VRINDAMVLNVPNSERVRLCAVRSIYDHVYIYTTVIVKVSTQRNNNSSNSKKSTRRTSVCPLFSVGVVMNASHSPYGHFLANSTRKPGCAVARKPRDAAVLLFGLKFTDNVHYKFKSSQASKARLRAPNVLAQNRI